MVAPTVKKTKANDYLAADGMWYPSNKLEGYLAQPSPYSAMLAVLQEYYQIQKTLIDLTYKENPLIKLVPK